MPGNQVRRWDVYHALRREGKSKQSAARIANSQGRAKRVISSMARHERGRSPRR